MEILYCSKWWFARKRPIEILDETTACNNHIQGIDYSVVMSESGIVYCILEMSLNDIFVNFMNEDGEKYLTYAFHREKEDDIFLNAAYYHNYENNIETEMIIFGFKTDGELCMEKRNIINGDVEERESVVDISCNWDKYPKFGDYSRLIVLEREINL